MTKIQKKETIDGYIAILPWLIGFFLFKGGPIIASFLLSLTDWNMLSPMKFIGLQNYQTLFNDQRFWQSVKVTVSYNVFAIPLGIVFAFAIALLLNQKIKGLAFWRAVYYLPAVVSGVAVSIMWMWIFNSDFGLLNAALAKIGIDGPRWLADKNWVIPALVVMSLWGAGGSMVIYLAGLQSIPTELYEAANIDGASAWHRFIHITIPQMTPIIFMQVVMGLINGFQYFTQAYVMTEGGPNDASLFYVLYLYQNGFRYFKMGYSATMAVILFIVILLLTLIIFKTSDKWVYYES